MDMEKLVKELGFENEQEFHSMIAKVNFNKLGLATFREWQYEDGTKDGLQKLINLKNKWGE